MAVELRQNGVNKDKVVIIKWVDGTVLDSVFNSIMKK
jgi:hypothetical protein